ncbi:hypothetical protein ACS0TY_003031 [Phlomoides rotata]
MSRPWWIEVALTLEFDLFPTMMDLLQFDDDIILIGAAKVENAWTIRRILINMDLLSGLTVNFDKCCLCGVNANDGFLRNLTDILGCRVGSIPFSYLGIKVGMNHRNTAEWSGIVQKSKTV